MSKATSLEPEFLTDPQFLFLPHISQASQANLSPPSLGQAATTSCLDLHSPQFHFYLFSYIFHPSQTLLFLCLKLFSGFPSQPNPLEIPTRPCMVWLLPISLHASAACAYSILGSVPNSPNSPFPASEPIPTGPTAPYPTLHPPLTICHPTSYQSFRPLSTEPFSDAPNKTIRQPIILKTWTFPSQNHPQFVNTYFLESKQKHQGQEKPCLFVHPCIPGA